MPNIITWQQCYKVRKIIVIIPLMYYGFMNETFNIKLYFSESYAGGICNSESKDNDNQNENSRDIMSKEVESSCNTETVSTNNTKIYETTKRFVTSFFAKFLKKNSHILS